MSHAYPLGICVTDATTYLLPAQNGVGAPYHHRDARRRALPVQTTIETKLVRIARVSCVSGAVVWILGLPVVALSSVPFWSDGSYYLLGLLTVLLGLAEIPIALA